ncbi:hypothetical protein CDL12_18910 [Handroanthus impetiginosus]|uniref:Uncharacterized protein n=1 Tax=Handroanthus impetiginosus TaxID=429701 RepID=A0A2G9GTD5_9LAMI|nr:hypothetical protein CDL12_18910 [Handroanthus impetiginosus]
MYGAEDPSIAGMVLDSPFSDLVDLMMELVDTYRVRLPKFTVKFAIQYMRRAILKKAKFDIMDLNAIKVAKSCFVPVLFGHAIDDDFIQPHHSDRIFDAYVGDKNIIKFEGDHNSPRPQFYFDSISIFFNNVLQPPVDEVGSTYFDLSHDYFGKGGWRTVHDLDYTDEILGSPTGPATTSTEDAIKQLRSRRPMSSIVVPSDISSKDKQPDAQVESRGSDSHASSSNMISFELSSSSPHGSHVPASIDDDDEYVQYPLDTLADFPSNVEEEERMLMEAVLESLKDLNMAPPRAEEASSNGGVDLEPKSEPNNGQEEDSSSMKTELVATSAADEHKPASQTLSPEIGTQETCLPNDTSSCNNIVPDADRAVVTNQKSSDATPHQTGGEKTEGPSHSDTAVGEQSSSQVDMADRTKVTVKVEKTPTSNIMDGLLRRWDLNFFRNR